MLPREHTVQGSGCLLKAKQVGRDHNCLCPCKNTFSASLPSFSCLLTSTSLLPIWLPTSVLPTVLTRHWPNWLVCHYFYCLTLGIFPSLLIASFQITLHQQFWLLASRPLQSRAFLKHEKAVWLVAVLKEPIPCCFILPQSEHTFFKRPILQYNKNIKRSEAFPAQRSQCSVQLKAPQNTESKDLSNWMAITLFVNYTELSAKEKHLLSPWYILWYTKHKINLNVNPMHRNRT